MAPVGLREGVRLALCYSRFVAGQDCEFLGVGWSGVGELLPNPFLPPPPLPSLALALSLFTSPRGLALCRGHLG